MKKVIVLCCTLFLTVPTAQASQLNLDPYFGLGASMLTTEIAGDTTTSPAYHFLMGSRLNWVNPELALELRFGYGGYLGLMSSNVLSSASYLLKQGFEVSKAFDVYAIAGYSSVSVVINGLSDGDSGFSYGAGFVFHVPNESFSMMGEWMNIYTSSDNSATAISGMDVSGLSFNLVYEYY